MKSGCLTALDNEGFNKVYELRCPDSQLQVDFPTTQPKIIRIQFHNCFVQNHLKEHITNQLKQDGQDRDLTYIVNDASEFRKSTFFCLHFRLIFQAFQSMMPPYTIVLYDNFIHLPSQYQIICLMLRNMSEPFCVQAHALAVESNKLAFSSDFRSKHFSVMADWQKIIGLGKSISGPQNTVQHIICRQI